uniref:BED-type domain-containing protein n=1 Tax=Oryza nivara TaxID=4536 RepID=A0A0E0I7V5_ORYNI
MRKARATAAASKPKPRATARAKPKPKPKTKPSPASFLSGGSSPASGDAADDLSFLSPSSPVVKPKPRSPLAAPASSPISPYASPASASVSVSTVADLRILAASHLDSLKRRLDALHGDSARDLEASHSRISKRFKTQSCLQLADEAEKEHRKMADKISEHAEAVKASYKKFVAEVQASTSRVCKVTIPEMAKSADRAIDGLRSRYNIPATAAYRYSGLAVMDPMDDHDSDELPSGVASDEAHVAFRARTKKRSKVWDEYKPIYVNGVVQSAECRYCHILMSCKGSDGHSNGTSHLWRHQKICRAKEDLDLAQLHDTGFPYDSLDDIKLASHSDNSRFRSKVWEEFMPVYVEGRIQGAECLHCHKRLSADKGRSHLNRHTQTCPARGETGINHKSPFSPSSAPSFKSGAFPSEELLSAEDYKVVESICKILRAFYRAIEVISGPVCPTANVYFNELWKVRTTLQEEASTDHTEVASMVREMQEAFHEYWENSYLWLSIPIVLDPRFKITFIEFRLKRAFGAEAAKYVAAVREIIRELFHEYCGPVDKGVHTSNNEARDVEMDGFDIGMSGPKVENGEQNRRIWYKRTYGSDQTMDKAE